MFKTKRFVVNLYMQNKNASSGMDWIFILLLFTSVQFIGIIPYRLLKLTCFDLGNVHFLEIYLDLKKASYLENAFWRILHRWIINNFNANKIMLYLVGPKTVLLIFKRQFELHPSYVMYLLSAILLHCQSVRDFII